MRQWKTFYSDEELQRNQVNTINKYQCRMEFDAERTQLKIPTLQQRNECQLEQVPEEPVQFQRQDIFRPYEPRAESHEFQSRTQGDIDRDHRPIYEQSRRRWGTEQVHTATSNGQVRNEQEFALAVDRTVENAMRRLPSSGSGSQKNTPIKLPPFNGKGNNGMIISVLMKCCLSFWEMPESLFSVTCLSELDLIINY